MDEIQSRNEAVLRAVMDTVLDGLITIDAGGVIQSFNASAERIFGYQASEVIGRNIRMLMPEPYHSRHDGYIQTYLKTGESKVLGSSTEVEARRKDGSVFPMEVGINAMMVDGARMFVGTIRDISEAKQDKERMALLAAAVESSDDAIMTKTLDGVITSWNRGAERLFGYNAEEAVGQHINFIIPPHHQEEETHILTQIRAGRRVEHLETVRRRKNGNQVPISLTISPIYNADGQLTGASKIARDISERKTAQRRSAEKAARMRTVMDTVLDGLITIDSRGVIQSFNASAERIFGYKPSEVIGQNVRMLMPEPYHAEHDGYIRNYLTTGERKITGIGREVEALRKDGTVFPMELGVNEMMIDGERAFVGTIRDITERKAMDRMKDEFVSTVNHELRTPLSSIYGSVRLLSDMASDQLDDKSRRLLELAQTNCARLTRIVDDILDLEKIMAGKIDYQLEAVKAGSLIQDVVDRHLSMAERFGATFKTDIDVPGLIINVDPSRFNQALVNLLSNAAKYSPPDGVVTITARREGELIRVSVADNGPGIPESFRDKIFERFARADGSTTRKADGNGLGLNITKTLIEAFGGEVTFDSVEGEGSTFHFLLPIHSETAEDAGGLKRILYLEDDDSIAELAITALQTIAGFEVLHCSTGRDAVAAAEAFDPHLFLFDVMVPDMDGPQTLAKIRALPAGLKAPAVFVTAKAQIHEQKAYLDDGACGVIVKPFDPLTLGARVESLWRDAQLSDRAA